MLVTIIYYFIGINIVYKYTCLYYLKMVTEICNKISCKILGQLMTIVSDWKILM